MVINSQITIEYLEQIGIKVIQLVSLILSLKRWLHRKTLPTRNSIITPKDYQYNISVGRFYKDKWEGISPMAAG